MGGELLASQEDLLRNTFTRPAAPEKTTGNGSAYSDLATFYGCFRKNSPWSKAADSVEIIRKMRDEW
jgi:hypothetical protein